MTTSLSIAHKASFLGLATFTVASPVIAGVVAYHSTWRLGVLCFAAMIALLVWSLLLVSRARFFAVVGLVALVVTFWMLIMIPGYIEAKRRSVQPHQSSQYRSPSLWSFAGKLPTIAFLHSDLCQCVSIRG